MAVFECRTFKEVMSSKAIKMGLTPMWPVLLWEGEIWTHIDFRHVCKEERPGEDREKTVICKPRKEVWGEIKPADTLTVDCLASRTVENTFLWFMPLSLWYFVKYTDVNKSRKTIKRKKTIIQNLSSSYILMGKGGIGKHVIDNTEYMENSPKIMQHEKHEVRQSLWGWWSGGRELLGAGIRRGG